MRIKIAVLLQCIFLCTHSASAVNIEMVIVGNPGNAPDKRYNTDRQPEGIGSVDRVYQIGKYEITAGQYTEFLNAVAGDDPHELFNGGGNIKRSGTSPNFNYSVAPDWADRPINVVTFWNAARFCNWLHNNQPIGPQGLGTTEEGAYHDIGDQVRFGRNADATFFIPTEDEWYKAAYHDSASGSAANYFEYPTRTNAAPGRDATETTNPGNNANYAERGSPFFQPYLRTLVGEFELSVSPYGTYDQGGNVWEWTESVDYTESRRRIYGGGFVAGIEWTSASYRRSLGPSVGDAATGFRIAAAAPVPEPTCIALVSIAAVMLGGSRYRTRRT